MSKENDSYNSSIALIMLLLAIVGAFAFIIAVALAYYQL